MGSKSSSAPAPDPRLVEAQIRSMGIQDDVIKRVMQQSEEVLPLQKEQLQFGLDASRTAFDQAQADRTYALERRGQLTSMQDVMIDEARDFNTEDRGKEIAAQAGADVEQAFANQRQASGRAMARMGINPNSGRSSAMDAEMGMAQATAKAGIQGSARQAARAEGRALTDRASNALAGYPAMGMSTTGSGAGFGAAGINIVNQGLAGMNSGYSAAGTMAGQMGQNAASMYGAMGSYKNGADNAAANANPMGALLGAGAQLGAAYIKSDPRLKQNIELVGRDERTGLNLYEFAYKNMPHERWRGVMADEVLQVMPSAVHANEEGFMSVDYGALGIEMTKIGETP